MSISDQNQPVEVYDSFTRIAPYYDKLMVSVPYRFWVSYIQAVWKHHGIEPKRVLDLACGTGTVSLHLAKTGLDLVGVDLSAVMIEQAKIKAKEERLDVEFYAADAATMSPVKPSVDSAICLFDSLNNIIDYDQFTSALRNVKRSLREDGLFIFDLNTSYAFRQGMFNQKSSLSDRPLKYVWKSKYDESTNLCTVNMEFEILEPTQPSQKFTEIHVQRAYNKMEVEEALQDAGFTDICSYDAYSLFPPKKRSDRIHWVAR